jgi:hypothetical protein
VLRLFRHFSKFDNHMKLLLTAIDLWLAVRGSILNVRLEIGGRQQNFHDRGVADGTMEDSGWKTLAE